MKPSLKRYRQGAIPPLSGPARESRTRRLFALLGSVLALFAAACAGPNLRQDRMAAEAGLIRLKVPGQDFDHVVYERPRSHPGATLHVYISGDGTPWVARTGVASDPTPRNPVALRLLMLDPAPSLLLGRPCYQGLARTGPCSPALWTSARYSEQVVASMARALERLISKHRCEQVVLIGYSGGGVLAWLLAERVPQVRQLITIAANLDIDAWTRLHDYSRLSHSLNPATRVGLPARVSQLHLIGSHDRNVPPELVRGALRRIADDARIVQFAASHGCCWEKQWPAILERISRRAPKDTSPPPSMTQTGE